MLVEIPPFPFAGQKFNGYDLEIYRADVTAGYYPLIDPIPWNHEPLWDIVNWMIAEGAPQPKYQPTANIFGLAPLDFVFTARQPGGSDQPLPTDATVLFSGVRGGVREQTGQHPVLVQILDIMGKRSPEKAYVYPGFDLRSRGGESPIGAEWPEHPKYLPTARVFHPSPADNLEKYGEWTRNPTTNLIEGPEVDVLQPSGALHRYQKKFIVTGQGFFFSGGVREYYWQDEGPSKAQQ